LTAAQLVSPSFQVIFAPLLLSPFNSQTLHVDNFNFILQRCFAFPKKIAGFKLGSSFLQADVLPLCHAASSQLVNRFSTKCDTFLRGSFAWGWRLPVMRDWRSIWI
jgi:hypothetical protein